MYIDSKIVALDFYHPKDVEDDLTCPACLLQPLCSNDLLPSVPL